MNTHKILMRLLQVLVVTLLSALTTPVVAANTMICFPGEGDVAQRHGHQFIGSETRVVVHIPDLNSLLDDDYDDQTYQGVQVRQVQGPQSRNELARHVQEAFYDRLPQYFVPEPDISLIRIDQVWGKVV